MYFGNYKDSTGSSTAGRFWQYDPRLVLIRKRYTKSYAPGALNRTRQCDPNYAFGLAQIDGEDNPYPWELLDDKRLNHPDINWLPGEYWPGTWHAGLTNQNNYENSEAMFGFGGEANQTAKGGHFSPDGDKFVMLHQYRNFQEYHTSSGAVDNPIHLHQWLGKKRLF